MSCSWQTPKSSITRCTDPPIPQLCSPAGGQGLLCRPRGPLCLVASSPPASDSPETRAFYPHRQAGDIQHLGPFFLFCAYVVDLLVICNPEQSIIINFVKIGKKNITDEHRGKNPQQSTSKQNPTAH